MRKLQQEPWLDTFFLVGGTSLAIQIGHRLSVDLDLFTSMPFDNEALFQSFEVSYQIQPLTRSENILISVVEGVKVDCVHFRYPLIYPIIYEEGLRLADIRDISSMKLDAVTKRGSKKDFFDMYFLFEIFSPFEILEWYSQMFKHSTSLHVIRSLTYFEDAELTEQPKILKSGVSWEKVKKRMVEIVRANF